MEQREAEHGGKEEGEGDRVSKPLRVMQVERGSSPVRTEREVDAPPAI